jgi:tryptophan-rich sensory protein
MSRTWILPSMLAALAALGVAMLGMTITELGPWYRSLQQPDWAPPDPVYGAAWTFIFALAAAAGVLAWRAAPSRRAVETLIGAFALNGFLNVLWSLMFFRMRRPDWALAELALLWLSIVLLLVVTGRHSRAAAVLLLPYFAWVSFAGVLNWEIVHLNGAFG